MKIQFKKVDYVMVMVENMNRSIEFYRDILGIPVKFHSENWTELGTGETTLALHSGGKRAVPSPSAGPHSDVAGTASIGFNVENLQETHEHLKSKGVRFSLPPTPRQNEGILLAVAIDPDGLEISFAQPVRAS